MSRLMLDGIAGPVSRGQHIRRKRGQTTNNFLCSTDHEQDLQLTRLVNTLYVVALYTHIIHTGKH